MAQAKIIWVENHQFVGIDSSKHSVVLSSQDENNAVGMKPSDLLLVALASCTAVDVVQILEKKRTPLSSMRIEVTGDQEKDPPWTFKAIHMDFKVAGMNLRSDDVKKAIELSENKYCSVSASLKGNVNITHSFEILNEH